MTNSGNRGKRPADGEAEGSRASRCRRRGYDSAFCPLCNFLVHLLISISSFSFIRIRVISSSQYHLLPPVTAAQPGTPSSGSSGSSSSSSSYHSNPWGSAEPADAHHPYSHEEALKFRQERDEAREELGDVSKKFGIDQAEWEDQRKQFCDAITGLISSFSFVILTSFACRPIPSFLPSSFRGE